MGCLKRTTRGIPDLTRLRDSLEIIPPFLRLFLSPDPIAPKSYHDEREHCAVVHVTASPVRPDSRMGEERRNAHLHHFPVGANLPYTLPA